METPKAQHSHAGPKHGFIFHAATTALNGSEAYRETLTDNQRVTLEEVDIVSKTIKIEIEIPAPPEGWGEVVFRRVTDGETDVKFWDGSKWANASGLVTAYQYPVARKLIPLWTPPPELVACLKPGWLTRDAFDICTLHGVKPTPKELHWISKGPEWRLNAINPNLLPPLTIPWEKCCFKIGEPQE
jgi:hypothetical protein